MNQKSITFSSNGFTLKGTLHLPAAEHPPVVVGSHGLFSRMPVASHFSDSTIEGVGKVMEFSRMSPLLKRDAMT